MMDNYLIRELEEDNAFLRSQVALLEARNTVLETRVLELKNILASHVTHPADVVVTDEGSAVIQSPLPLIIKLDSPKVASDDFIPYTVPSSFGTLEDDEELQEIIAPASSTSSDTVTLRRPFPIKDPIILRATCDFLSSTQDILEPFLFGAGQSEWCRVMRDKKTWVLVCKAWYEVGMESLYSYIRLRHIPYLIRLVQVLEAGVRGNDTGSGRWVRDIDLSFYIPVEWDEVYVEDVGRLLACCPNLVSFHNRPMLPETSVAGRSTPTAIMSTLSYLRGELLQVVELSEQEGPDMADLTRMLQMCPVLESLSVGFYVFKGALSPVPSVLRAPQLRSLSICMTAQLTPSLAATPSTNILLEASKWELPSIACLKITFDLHVRFPVSELDAFLNMHGHKLTDVRVRDIVGNRAAPLNVAIFANRCPNLMRLSFTPHNTQPISPTRPHLNLAQVTLYGKIGDPSHQQAHFSALTGIKFPTMRLIVTDAVVSPVHWRSAGARVHIETQVGTTTISARSVIGTDAGDVDRESLDASDNESDDEDYEPSSSDSSSDSSIDEDDVVEEMSDTGTQVTLFPDPQRLQVKHDEAIHLFDDMIQTSSVRRSVVTA